jgi:hypothetical protein
MGKNIINQMDAKGGENNKWLHVVITAVVSSVISSDVGKFTAKGKLSNRTDADYYFTVKKIVKLKQIQPLLFTQMYHLSPTAFDIILAIIELELLPKRPAANFFFHL